MTTSIAGFGAQVQVKASNTFPSGFVVSQFADDADPFDIPSIQIADKAMGLNGDLVTWSKANPITITINPTLRITIAMLAPLDLRMPT